MTHASAVTLRERRVRRLAPPPATLVPLLFLVSLLIAQVNAGEEEDDLVDFITDEWRGPRGDAPDAVDPHEWLGALTWEERQPPRRQPNATSQSQGAAAAGRPAVSPFDAFVRVEDTRFMLGCAEYKVAGWNTYTLIEQAARVPTGSFEFDFSRAGRRQVIDMFDAAVGAGFNTVRTWAYSVGKHQSMQTAPGVYHEPLFEGLDWVIYQAGLRGLRLILVFTDYWEYNGGVAQYLDWSGTVATGKNVFFGDRRCKEMYKANVKQVIERVNAYTGVAYRDDPAIMAWELINEPRCRNCAGRLQQWIEEMARYVKSLDPHHLLSTGEEGFYTATSQGTASANPEVWAFATGQDFVANHDVPEIDYAVAHLWPDNWGVFSLGLSLENDFSVEWIEAHTRDAHEVLGKPFVLEEFGVTGAGSAPTIGIDIGTNGGGQYATAATAGERARRAEAVAAYYRRVYTQIERASASGRAIQGSMFWTWHHEHLREVAEPLDNYAIFLGDPVFAEMRRHASVMRGTATERSLRACGGRRSGSEGGRDDVVDVRVTRNDDANLDLSDDRQPQPEQRRGAFGVFMGGRQLFGDGGLFNRLLGRQTTNVCLFGTLLC